MRCRAMRCLMLLDVWCGAEHNLYMLQLQRFYDASKHPKALGTLGKGCI